MRAVRGKFVNLGFWPVDRSAERKKDGAVKDFVRNLGRGAEEALRTGAKAPTDLTRYLTKKRLTRLVFLPPPFSR